MRVVENKFRINLYSIHFSCTIGHIENSINFMHFVKLLPVTQPKVAKRHRSDGSYGKGPWAQVEEGPDSRSCLTPAAAVPAAPSGGRVRVRRSWRESRSGS